MSILLERLIKLANKPGFTPAPSSFLKAPVKKPSGTSKPSKLDRLYLSGLEDPLPKDILDKITKVYDANPGYKGGLPEISGVSLGIRF